MRGIPLEKVLIGLLTCLKYMQKQLFLQSDTKECYYVNELSWCYKLPFWKNPARFVSISKTSISTY